MPQEPLIILMRHGQIPQSEPRRFVGQRDLPLDRAGKEQADAAGRWLQACLEAGPELQGIMASDLERTRETAERVAAALGYAQQDVVFDSRLREINLGAWEGLSKAEVQEGFPGELERRGRELDTHRPKNAESFQDLQQRVCQAFEDIAARTTSLQIIVAHAGVNRTLLCSLLGMPLKHVFHLGQDYCAVNFLRRTPERWVVQHLNVLPWAAGGVVV